MGLISSWKMFSDKLNKYMKYIIRVLTILIVSVPLASYAMSIIPCDGPTGVQGGTGKVCDFTTLIALGNNIIRFCIITGTSVFSIMFMYAGFKYLTANGNPGQISTAHNYFLNAIIGFVIMLSAWLLVDFIFKSLLKPSGGASVDDYRLI